MSASDDLFAVLENGAKGILEEIIRNRLTRAIDDPTTDPNLVNGGIFYRYLPGITADHAAMLAKDYRTMPARAKGILEKLADYARTSMLLAADAGEAARNVPALETRLAELERVAAPLRKTNCELTEQYSLHARQKNARKLKAVDDQLNELFRHLTPINTELAECRTKLATYRRIVALDENGERERLLEQRQQRSQEYQLLAAQNYFVHAYTGAAPASPQSARPEELAGLQNQLKAIQEQMTRLEQAQGSAPASSDVLSQLNSLQEQLRTLSLRSGSYVPSEPVKVEPEKTRPLGSGLLHFREFKQEEKKDK